jgi:hypothetical protein
MRDACPTRREAYCQSSPSALLTESPTEPILERVQLQTITLVYAESNSLLGPAPKRGDVEIDESLQQRIPHKGVASAGRHPPC